MSAILEKLLALCDQEYKKFNSALIPNINSDTVIGVRVPNLRKLAKEIYKSGEYEEFLKTLPHEYYEENCLHAYIISEISDFDKCIEKTEEFLPFIDNWAVCDTFSPKIFAKNKQKLLERINLWLRSTHTYTVRFGVCMLMKHFLDDDFKAEHLAQLSKIDSSDYYVKMVIAWYFATALSKQYDSTIPYIENKLLPTWTHNKTIQKAVESFRIDKNTKEYLKSLRIK